jgi:hypothetical protein
MKLLITILILIIVLIAGCISGEKIRSSTHFSTNVPEGYKVIEKPQKDAEKILPEVTGGLAIRWGDIFYNNTEIGTEITLNCINVGKCYKDFLGAWGYYKIPNITEKNITIGSNKVVESDMDGYYCYYAGYSSIPNDDPLKNGVQFFIVCTKSDHKEVALSIITDLLKKPNE